ncbi:hypothetical protein cyc_05900 [Cyclospora cayetanensis]|uniref:Uncharacterized protein n=1 Tax=Cyclospora cayetanensis TaxID=88456 RepID=A0A1D3D2S9_9EIME|nr:hypothetical protein cyc_05900 [Cyclospora cayetanensis]
MATMVSLSWVPFVLAALVSAAVEQNSDVILITELAINDKAGGADLTSNLAGARTHLQSFQKDEDGFGGKKKLSLVLAAALGTLLATLLVLHRSKLTRLLGFVESVPGDGLSEEVSTTG